MSTATDPTTEQLMAELYTVDGKVEIVDRKIVRMSPTEDLPNGAGGPIDASLLAYGKQHGGRAYPDNAAFLVNLPNRRSFRPGASYYRGPHRGANFLPMPPVIAAEASSEDKNGPSAEQRIAAKRADDFAAGTKVVWDVDVLRAETISEYRADAPDTPTVYHRGELAEAEPAVPGWKFPVDELFV